MVQVVRLVTPTDPQTNSIKAFRDQLFRVKNYTNIDYRVYSASDDNLNLADLANYAIADSPAAVVACGWMAASKLLSLAPPTLPIVLAAGSAPVPPPPLPTNLTGYTLTTVNGQPVASHHVQRLNAKRITVLYDDTNDPSVDIYNNLPSAIPQGSAKTLIPLKISNPAQFATHTVTTDGFMLIPNAMYFIHCKDIADMVDDNDNVTAVYYPEPEYKEALKNNPNKANVFGHDIEGTFRDAANIVYNILTNYYPRIPGGGGGLQLPAVVEARAYQDE
jgi:hypothetical protein